MEDIRKAVLQFAEMVDANRIFPRILVGTYTLWGGWFIWQLAYWYTHLPVVERTINDAGFVTAVISAVTGFGVPIYRIYSDNGRDWKDHPPPQ